MKPKTVILADGSFPVHNVPLGYLREARHIICCDGGAKNLVLAGLKPEAIIGDLDSLDPEFAGKYADRLFRYSEQETNDLTKAVMWCYEAGYRDLIIVGATGKREDHTIGNISLLAEYSQYVDVMMVTDTGFIMPFQKSCKIESFPAQQVSVFSINPETEITSTGLRYPLKKRKLKNWWEATLNEAIGAVIEIKFSGGPVLVFLGF